MGDQMFAGRFRASNAIAGICVNAAQCDSGPAVTPAAVTTSIGSITLFGVCCYQYIQVQQRNALGEAAESAIQLITPLMVVALDPTEAWRPVKEGQKHVRCYRKSLVFLSHELSVLVRCFSRHCGIGTSLRDRCVVVTDPLPSCLFVLGQYPTAKTIATSTYTHCYSVCQWLNCFARSSGPACCGLISSAGRPSAYRAYCYPPDKPA